jgi:KAP family P-loop domain
VFIDDLDRTDPTVVPKLLLALRELLDVPKFVFVLAFDRGTVSRALAEYNTAWGPSGEAFLEKIIDFPFELPTPTPGQVKALAVRQFGELRPFVPLDRLNEVAALLPDNPVRPLKPEVLRHEGNELDWTTILIFHLLHALRLSVKYFLQPPQSN